MAERKGRARLRSTWPYGRLKMAALNATLKLVNMKYQVQLSQKTLRAEATSLLRAITTTKNTCTRVSPAPQKHSIHWVCKISSTKTVDILDLQNYHRYRIFYSVLIKSVIEPKSIAS